MRNMDVAEAWRWGERAATRHFSTNGRSLYSYALRIGYTDEAGRKILEDHTATSRCFHSLTTSQHVGLAKPFAHQIISPKGDLFE